MNKLPLGWLVVDKLTVFSPQVVDVLVVVVSSAFIDGTFTFAGPLR